MKPQGIRIGWIVGTDVYLEPETSLRAANDAAADGEGLGVSTPTLKKRLREAGLLVSRDGSRETLTVLCLPGLAADRRHLHSQHAEQASAPVNVVTRHGGAGVDQRGDHRLQLDVCVECTSSAWFLSLGIRMLRSSIAGANSRCRT